MLRNFFLIALRNITKRPGFTLINITGLAVGLASSMLLLMWVMDELGYERFNSRADRIYRIEEDQFYSGQKYHVSVTPFPSGPEWKEKIPEIEEQVRIFPWMPRMLFRNGEKVSYETSVIAADSTLLKIFSFDLLEGDSGSLLNDPHSILLTQKLAAKYFGKESPVGKPILVENKYQFTVTGVLRDLPGNTLFTFNAVMPFSFLKETGMYDDHWGSNSIYTFMLMSEGFNSAEVNKKLTDVVLEHEPETQTKYSVFPLVDIHLYGQFGYTETKGLLIIVIIFSLIAVFLLLIACINFINLATARAASRGKEIGIKKVSGSDKRSLVYQFMMESMLQVAAAMVIAFILIGLSLGLFNNISGKLFVFSDLLTARFLLAFLSAGLVAGFVSGVYPSFYMSAINPVKVLKGETLSGRGNGRLRQVLVVVQFTLSILIALSAVFMYRQLAFMQEKDLGFDKNNLIAIQMGGDIKSKYYSLKKELEKDVLIQGVTAALWNPVRIGSNSGGASWPGKDPDKHVLIGTNGVDYDYISTLKMELVSGRDFSREFPSDFARDTTGNFLINEEVVRLMDVGDPIGKSFSFMGISGTIIGVMKNFHFKGADQPIEPVAFLLADTSYLSQILIRLTPGNVPGSLKAVEKVWKEVLPEYPLDYSFIDQDYSYHFRTVNRVTKLLGYFTVLAVFIACIGLFGLASYSAEKRTNEIGIRKVMGAGSLSVIYSMSKEFILLVMISIVIAFPAGWFILKKLLTQFPYRIDLEIWVFGVIALATMGIALLTVIWQSYRASGINPAQALKLE
ncbi:MAG TPA: ABC transporter permease [Bacteroidales bacterium]|nr:ABC transporter permease [Bacteroidales bacterium]